jgi:hypothetical protein
VKRHFVADENVIILAHTRTTDDGDPDDTCLQLVREIVQNCHAFALTPEIWGKYSHQVRVLERQRRPLTPGVMRLIALSLTNQAKDTRYFPDAELIEVSGLDRLPDVNPGDRVFVRCAASVRDSILATTDRPLLETLQGAAIPRQYGFTATRPEAARRFATPEGG